CDLPLRDRRLHPLAPHGGPGRHRPHPPSRGGHLRLRGEASLLDAEDPPGPHRGYSGLITGPPIQPANRLRPVRPRHPGEGRSLRYGEPVSKGRHRRSGQRGKDTMSSTFHVRGGRPLDGAITVRGAKNLVSKAMVAALLGESPSILRSVPDISDVRIVSNLLSIHGVKIKHDVEGGVLELDPSNVERAHVADSDAHAGSSRIPILFCGPLLHRLGEAIIPDLGGCRVGARPTHYPHDVLRSVGAVVDKREMGFHTTAPDGLRGTKIHLEYPSVGATEQVLLTAVRAQGITELTNAAVEPEIEDLIAVLQKMGA